MRAGERENERLSVLNQGREFGDCPREALTESCVEL